NAHDFSYYFRNNIWVTTSGNMSREAFACTESVLGIDRMLFGSDYPYEDVFEMTEFANNLRLGKLDREKLYYKNAEALGIKI
ncbi:MAG: amidohydrolase family protein, partial [Saezia sp.]